MTLGDWIRALLTGKKMEEIHMKMPLTVRGLIDTPELTDESKKALLASQLRSMEIRLNLLENEADVIMRRDTWTGN